ncbi:MAG: hypothetical protein ACOC0Z_07315 [Halohasta sp.]
MTIILAGLITIVSALGSTLLIGLRRREAAVVVNAVGSLVAVAAPIGVDPLVAVDGASGSVPVQLSLLVGIAGLLHMLGMIGWYDRIWWWDHVTHTVSAALIAAIIYAWLLVVGVDTPTAAAVGPKPLTVGLTMLAGIVWELAEWALRLLSDRLGIERVVKRYGRFDTPLDILFDFVGAMLVVAVDLRLLAAVFASIPEYAQLLVSGLLSGLLVAFVVSMMIIVYGYAAW